MCVDDCFNIKIGGGVGLATGSKGQGNPCVNVQCTQCIPDDKLNFRFVHTTDTMGFPLWKIL